MRSTQSHLETSEHVTLSDRRKIDEQLERMLVHPLFRHSKRLPAFLKFIVHESLQHGDEVPPKERTLGIAVFGRKPDYDTATDPVVRVTATELRKKLAQYYYEGGGQDEIRIELPPGSYLPKFRKLSPAEASAAPERVEDAEFVAAATAPDQLSESPPTALLEPAIAEPATPAPLEPADEVESGVEESQPSRWRAIAICLRLALICALAGYGPFLMHRESTLEHFWSSFGGKAARVLIVMPVIPHHDMTASPSDVSVAPNLSIEDTNIAARVAAQLEMRHLNYRLVPASELDFGNLRGAPAILIGALDNVWTMRLDKALPFAFEESADERTGRIVDMQDPAHHSWSLDITTPHSHISRDYGIIARYRDTMTGEWVLILAGISSQGTQAAGETVTNPEYLQLLTNGKFKSDENFEAIVETEAIDGRSGPPRVIARKTW